MGIVEAVLVVCGAVVLVATAYALRRASRPPEGGVSSFGARPPGVRRIVCAGDSLTHGVVSFDYVSALRARLGPGIEVVNAGVNGDFAFNVAERLPAIVACDPTDVVVLVGTIDVCAAQTPGMGARMARGKGLPEAPSLALFERELRRVLHGLRERTTARILVVTPPLAGEDVEHPVHERLRTYAARVVEIAASVGAPSLRLDEAMAAALVRSGHTPRRGFTPGPVELSWMFLVPFQRYWLGMSYDRIARGHGLWGSPDLVHLNETSGAILVDGLVEALNAPGAT
jgi:lysophospholipase L1-like esterase